MVPYFDLLKTYGVLDFLKNVLNFPQRNNRQIGSVVNVNLLVLLNTYFLVLRHFLVENGNRFTFKLVPKGLKNIGNTCYFNSVLQAVASCPSFMTHLNQIETNKQKDSFGGVLLSTLKGE